MGGNLLRGSSIVALCLTSIGCADAGSGSAPIAIRDSADIVIVENDLPRSSAACPVDPDPTVIVGAAGGGDEQELYRVFGASRLSDGRIVLVNQGSQELRFYDREGRFEMSAGRAGRGPGEFENAFYLWALPGDTIWVGDYRPWQLHVFAPDGEWVRTVRPTPEYANVPGTINVLDDGRAVLAREPLMDLSARFELRHMTVVLHDSNGQLTDTIGTYPNGRWGTVGEERGSIGLFPLFESFTRVAAAGSRLVIGHGSEPELSIFDVTDTARLVRLVRWTTGPRSVSPEDVEAERQRLAERYDSDDLDPARRRLLVEPLISDERPAADRFPAFAGVMLGRDGRIWVREYARPGGPATNAWVAFDSDGRFECLATLPSLDQVLEFGEDYLLALDRDDLDIERVVALAIGPPGEGRRP